MEKGTLNQNSQSDAGDLLASVTRSGISESSHRGHLIVTDGSSEPLIRMGNPETVTFIRSAAKPFQLIPCLLTGAAEHFGFTEKEIALACASHSGEDLHTSIAGQMLDKIGLQEADLGCGIHLPFFEKKSREMIHTGERPTQLHNNCSGKHAAMLAFAKKIGADTKTYLENSNPIQRQILECIAEFAEIDIGAIGIGVDGCSAPNFSMPVSAMANSFLRLVAPPVHLEPAKREACNRIVDAMIKYPEVIGGTDRLDTLVMQAAEGRAVCKVGAEGVWLCGVLPSERWPRGLGIGLKIEDGEEKRARTVVAVALLKHLGVIDDDALPELSPMKIHTRKRVVVGEVICERLPDIA